MNGKFQSFNSLHFVIDLTIGYLMQNWIFALGSRSVVESMVLDSRDDRMVVQQTCQFEGGGTMQFDAQSVLPMALDLNNVLK